LHHPPVSAFFVRNKKQNITVQGDVTFSVGFGSNYASVNTAGHVKITTNKETYVMSKVMPNMMVNNVIWGEKYLMWTGVVEIVCPESGYSATLSLQEIDHRNIVSGSISKKKPAQASSASTSETSSSTTSSSTSETSSSTQERKAVFKLAGWAGEKVYYAPVGEGESEDDVNVEDHSEKKLLFDLNDSSDNIIQYLPEEVQTEFNSLKLWQPVKQAIVINNMYSADEEKKKIEKAQREREAHRRANDLTKTAAFFTFVTQSAVDKKMSDNPDEDGDVVSLEQGGYWRFSNTTISIDDAYIEKIKEQAELVRKELGSDDSKQNGSTAQGGQGGTCVVS